MTMTPEMTLAIVGEDSMISRIFGVGTSDESVNVEVLTEPDGTGLADAADGFLLITNRQPFALIDGNGVALVDGSDNHLLGF